MRFLVFGLGALVLAGAAIGSGGGGGLAACAKTANGQLRLANGGACDPSEQPVQLGTGAATQAVERYDVAPDLRDPSTFLPIGNARATATKVVTMHVAAGDYAVASQITFTGSGGAGEIPCILVDAAGHSYGYGQAAYDSSARTETLTLDGALHLDADADLSLTCWNIQVDGGTAAVRAADITTKTVDTASITQEVH